MDFLEVRAMASVLVSDGFIGCNSLPSAEARQERESRNEGASKYQPKTEGATHACISNGVLGEGMSRHQPRVTNNGDGRGGSGERRK